jgi:hypothetical protein
MAELRVERSRRAPARRASAAAPTTTPAPARRIGASTLDAQNSRRWLVSEPAKGKLPAVTEAARQRAQARALRKHEAPDTYTDLSL